jgi:hypothetical protein
MIVGMTLVIWVQKLTLVCKVGRCPGAKGRPPPDDRCNRPDTGPEDPPGSQSIHGGQRGLEGSPWHGFRCSTRTLKVSRGPGVDGASQVIDVTLVIRIQRNRMVIRRVGRQEPQVAPGHP